MRGLFTFSGNHKRLRSKAGRRGAAAVEYALVYAGIILPLTSMLIFTAELLWVWNSGVDFTNRGARYAATHCWQPDGGNVVSNMRENTPIMFDRQQFIDGQAEIEVRYFGRNAESGDLEDFSCDGSQCSRECVPETVRVRISNYEFRAFVSYLGLPPVPIPDFQTTLPMESAGCSPDSEECLP